MYCGLLLVCRLVLLFRSPNKLEVSHECSLLWYWKERFGLPSCAFTFWEDVLPMVAYQEFRVENPSLGSLALSTLQHS